MSEKEVVLLIFGGFLLFVVSGMGWSLLKQRRAMGLIEESMEIYRRDRELVSELVAHARRQQEILRLLRHALTPEPEVVQPLPDAVSERPARVPLGPRHLPGGPPSG